MICRHFSNFAGNMSQISLNHDKMKQLFNHFSALAFSIALLTSCNTSIWTPDGKDDPDDPSIPSNPSNPSSSADPDYFWDMDALPEITLEVPLAEWNTFLSNFDKDNKTKEYIHCDVTFKKGSDVFTVRDAGMRMRGNTSRRHPESGGSGHISGNTDWHHFHIGLNFHKFNKDKEHKIKGINRVNLKWFNNDPSYIREVFCFDLFRRAGVWTASRESFCRVYIHVAGDDKPAYYGVYAMIEPYDNKYLERNAERYGNKITGNLWKCTYPSSPADLKSTDDRLFGQDDNMHDYTYELKETGADFATAKAQIQDFIKKLNGKGEESFKKWIAEVCDVELLLRTYAVNVAVGMWDDYWNNGNNYYLYFDSQDMLSYKVYMLPYDYDNTLGTSNCYDPATRNPLDWGDKGDLIERLLRFDDYRKIYVDCLKELVAPGSGLMDYESASSRINLWHQKIQPYVSNDTGEDMEIKDQPAGWSNYHYPILGDGGYLKTKAATINSLK